jgi:hypothetical protein
MTRRALSLVLPGLGLALSGCQAQLPGDTVGTFDIAMKLETNTCGQNAVYVTDGRHFAAQLRADEKGRVFWRVPMQSPLEGTRDGDTYTFTFSSPVATSAPDAGAFCQLYQTAKIVAKVSGVAGDAGVDAAVDAGAGDGGASDELTLSASYTLDIAPTGQSDCHMEIAPSGVFTALPCSVSYSLSGTLRDDF